MAPPLLLVVLLNLPLGQQASPPRPEHPGDPRGSPAFADVQEAPVAPAAQMDEWVFRPTDTNIHLEGVLEFEDVDGDGVRDVLVGTQNQGGRFGGVMFEGYGSVVCVSGKDARIHWQVTGPQNRLRPNRFGQVMAPVGDADGDGIGDVAMGIPCVPAGPGETDWYPSTVVILSGKTGARIREHAGSPDRLDGFGVSIAQTGDIDGDGNPDYVIGASNASFYEGYVTPNDSISFYSGRKGTLIARCEASQLGLADHVGRQLTCAGDLNGDGMGDLAVMYGYGAYFGGGWVVLDAKTRQVLSKIDSAIGLIGSDLVFPGDWTGDGACDMVCLFVDGSTKPGRISIGLFSGKDGVLVRSAILERKADAGYDAHVDYGKWRLLLVRTRPSDPSSIRVVSSVESCVYSWAETGGPCARSSDFSFERWADLEECVLGSYPLPQSPYLTCGFRSPKVALIIKRAPL